MAPPLNFVLSSITQAKKGGTDQWRAILRAAWLPNRHMELWFQDEATARKLPMGAIGIPDILGLYLTARQTVLCRAVIKTPQFTKRNLYTGKIEKEDAWAVHFETPSQDVGLQGMSLAYPTYSDTLVWKLGQPYDLPAFIAAVSPPQTMAIFVCQITLANATPAPFSAANVTGVVVQVVFGGADVPVPQLSFAGKTLTIQGTLQLSDVFAGQGLAQASTQASGNTVTLLSLQGINSNLWAITGAWNPAAVMGLMQPQIVPYPAANYVALFESTGFFDKFGYHPPGSYPSGNFTGGFVWFNDAFLTGAASTAFFGFPILGDNAILQSVSAAGVSSVTVDGNQAGIIVAGYNAGQIQFQAF